MFYTQVSGVNSWGFNEFVSIGYRTNVSFEVKQKKPQTFLTLAGKLNLKKDSHCLTLLKIKMLFCHCSSTILFITCIKQSKEKTPFCPRTFPFVIYNNKKKIALAALWHMRKKNFKTNKYSHPGALPIVQSCIAKNSRTLKVAMYVKTW